VLEGDGRVGEYAGGYSDWVRQRKPAPDTRTEERKAPPSAPPPRKERGRRLTFKETAELAELPDRIDTLERERDALYASLADVAVLRDGAAVAAAKARLDAVNAEIESLTLRWEALETIAAQ